MAYELHIGWRYLYSGRINRLLAMIAASFGVIAIVGLVLMLTGPSLLGSIMFMVGLAAAGVFMLLSVFSVFVSMSIFGVALGAGALTAMLAMTSGFQQQFRDKVLGVNAHVIVLKNQQNFEEYRKVMAVAQDIDSDVLAVQPFIFAEMLATRGKGKLSGVAIKGVDPKLVSSVLDLEKHMIAGSVDALAAPVGPDKLPPIIMGKELAHKLNAKIGDDLTVVVPLSNIDFSTYRATASAPRTRKFRVAGIFYAGFDEYDRRLMYTSLTDTQELVGRGDIVMGVELKVRDVDRAKEIAEALEAKLDPAKGYQVQDWYELNRNLFTALTLQKIVLVILLALIIAVAGVNMVSALFMMVIDKTREVAMLKSMGATSSGVMLVFQVVGLCIGTIGLLFGVTLGLSFCMVFAKYGVALDPKVYLIDRLPIEVHPFEVVLVCLITMGLTVLFTLVPSVIASSLRPVEGLRHE